MVSVDFPLNIFPTNRADRPLVSCSSDTVAYNIGASWIAHSEDEFSIRSGTSDFPNHPDGTKEDRQVCKFYPPFPRTPRYVFCAFSLINAPTVAGLRLHSEWSNLTKDGIEVKASTWEGNISVYKQFMVYAKVGLSYVALL